MLLYLTWFLSRIQLSSKSMGNFMNNEYVSSFLGKVSEMLDNVN